MSIAAGYQPLPRRCRAAEISEKLMPGPGRSQNVIPRRCRDAMENNLTATVPLSRLY
jgi:hypothetical protein